MNLQKLAKLSEREGKKCAQRVRAGEFTRADVQAEYDKYHDVEAVIALWWLDKWGIG